ncbi:uncharacterized protein LOC113941714, partial [Corapipo altera]|uniref:uncharacterized protein LOC113941714 n=1 Tax=Corapipo altera TaxID=415028 RepID=UPI000FD64941
MAPPVAAAAAALPLQQQQQQQRRRRCRRSRGGRVWSRSRSSAFWATVREKALGGHEWSERFRLPPATFDELVSRLGGAIGRRDTAMRRAVPAEVRLALTLSRLGAVTEYRALEATFGVSRSSVCKILRDVCGAVVRILGGDEGTGEGTGEGMGAGMGTGMGTKAGMRTGQLQMPTDLPDLQIPRDSGAKSCLEMGGEGGIPEDSSQELHLPMDLGSESRPAAEGSGSLLLNPGPGFPQNSRNAGNCPRRSSRKTQIPPNSRWESPENSGKTWTPPAEGSGKPRIPPNSKWESQENPRKRHIVLNCGQETPGNPGKRRILAGNSGKIQIPTEKNSGRPQIPTNSGWEPQGNARKLTENSGIPVGSSRTQPSSGRELPGNSWKTPLENPGKPNSGRDPPGNTGKAAENSGTPQIPMENAPIAPDGGRDPRDPEFRLPQLRGVLARLRVPIRAPPGGPPGLYRDRAGEGRHVVTLQATVDSRGCLWNVEIQPPGTRFRDSALFRRLGGKGGEG